MTRNTLFFFCAVVLATAASSCTVQSASDTGTTDMDSGRIPLPDTSHNDTNVTCTPGQINCNGTCTRVVGDSMNCGSCGNVCPSGTSCALGECTCLAPMLGCDGMCLDVSSDNRHCGDCTTACGPGYICNGGHCQCETTGDIMCGDSCVDPMSDGDNCGTCGNACTAGRTCVNGSCECPTGQGFCNGACIDVLADSMNCGTCHTMCGGGTMCSGGACVCPGAGEIACGGHCIDGQTDPLNCGACISSCGGAGGTCAGGRCTACGNGQTVCNGRCFDLQTSTLNCGGCSTSTGLDAGTGHDSGIGPNHYACIPQAVCIGGVCGCPADLTNCTTACADTQTNTAHCGACGHSCRHGELCEAGACVCHGLVCGGYDSGVRDAGSSAAGSCYDIQTDQMNCGACGHACVAPQVCNGGMCGCPGGQTACGTGCFNLQTSAAHCGACANDCGVGGVCNAGTCSCGSGYTACGADCAILMTDRDHCGSCDHPCATGQGCRAGVCVDYLPYHGWTSPVAGCDTASWNTMATTPLGGYYPYNTGDSAACRAWKLAATVCTTMPVPYGTDMVDFSCAMSGGFTDSMFGAFCASTATTQYACSDCYGSCNAGGCGTSGTGLTLRDCTGSEIDIP